MRRHARIMDPTTETDKHVRDALGYVPQREMTRQIEEGGKSSKTTGMAVFSGENLLSRAIQRLVFCGGLQATSDGDTARISLGPHLITSGLRPSYTLAAGAGTGATAVITGNDIAGLIQIVAGTTPATGVQITFKFAKPYDDTNYAMTLTGSNLGARGLATELGTSTKTVSDVQLSISTALTNGTTYQWNYIIVAFKSNT